MLNWLVNALRFDGIQDDELSPGSDWIWLTPSERLGVQSQADAVIAARLIQQRKESQRKESQRKESQ